MQCTINSGCFPRGKRAAVARRYPSLTPLPSRPCMQSFRVSVNPPNSDMDYGIFDVRT